MCKSNFNLFCLQNLFFIAVILLSFSSLQNAYASAVPVVQGNPVQNSIPTIKKVQKKKIGAQFLQQYCHKNKKHPEKTHQKSLHWGWIVAIWYAAFLTMLIVGIVLGIAALWITAVVFLSLPLLVVLVLLIIFLVALSKDGISLC